MNMHRTPKEEEVKYNLLGQEISKVKDEKDIGVLIDDELSFDKHICEMVTRQILFLQHLEKHSEI